MTVILNFYAGPGCGKSTSAAYVYSLLKRQSKSVELVGEYVKTWTYLDRKPDRYDQIFLMGQQIHRETLLLNKVDIVITDSPVMLGIYYAKKYSPPLISRGIESCIRGYYQQNEADGHRNMNIWLNRSKPYIQAGRFETEEEAKFVDADLRLYLDTHGIEYTVVDTDFLSLERLVDSLDL